MLRVEVHLSGEMRAKADYVRWLQAQPNTLPSIRAPSPWVCRGGSARCIVLPQRLGKAVHCKLALQLALKSNCQEVTHNRQV